MNAQNFLQRVEQTGMVSEPLLEELRKRVSETHQNMRPEMLAKLLVDRGELTAAQARKLVADAAQDPQSSATPPPPPPPPLQREEELTLAPEDDELGLAPEEDILGEDIVREDILGEDMLGEDILGEDIIEPTGPLQLAADEEDDEEEYQLQVEEDTAEAILIEEQGSAAVEPDPPPTSLSSTKPPDLGEPNPVLDDLLADPLVANAGAEGARLGPRRRGLASLFQGLFPRSLRPRKNRWDSPLILIGSGALILLIAAGIGFFALFYSETADEVFNAGMDAYASQSYGLAIKNFTRFSEKFPQHEKASISRVRIEMSKLRQITDSSSADWEAALKQANLSLPIISQETAFSEVRGELAKLLPDVSAGLVEKSKQSDGPDDKQRVLDLATVSLGLVNNPEYLPTSIRQPQEIRIEEIESSIQVVRRDIESAVALATTIQKINAAAEAGQITEAYRLRDDLMTRFPLLADDSALSDTLSSVTAKERDAVRVGTGTGKPLTSDHPPVAKASVVLSDQRGDPITDLDGHVLCPLVRGAVYGLDAADGSVLWRRHVGYETDIFPHAIAPDAGSDFLIVDARHGEVQRVEARTGKLVWRLPCPRPILSPRIYGSTAFVCCGGESDSALLAVDIATGQIAAEARFPVGCGTQPMVIESRKEVVQVGTHSSVYVLNAESLASKSVIPMGHARGSVVASPAYVGSTLVMAENSGNNASQLHVFSVGNADTWIRTSETITLKGQVTTTPSVDGRRVLIATELGELRVLEAPIDGSSIRDVAGVAASGRNLGPAYTLLDRSSLWVANQTFARYELQTTRGKLVSKWVRDRDDRFLSPLERRGSYLFHVRRRTGMMGATVSATRVSSSNNDGEPIWETDIGVPSTVVVNSKAAVHAVTMNGAMFPINAAAVRTGVTNGRSARIDPRLVPHAFSQQLHLSKDHVLFAGPPPTSHVTVADLSRGQLERIPLRIDADRVTSELVNFNGSLLAACDTGPIYLLDAASGAQRIGPFMPRIEPGARFDWLSPAPVGSNHFVAAEKSGHLYRVAVNNKQMTLAKENTIAGEFIGGLASVGNTAFVAARFGGKDQIFSINAKELTLGAQTPMANGLAWGPKRVGSLVIAADGNHTAYAFDALGRLRWKTKQPIGPLAGDPLITGEQMLFTSTMGVISVVDPSGNVIASQQIGEPIGSGPVAFKGSLLVAGWDGTLYMVDVPQ